MNYLDFKKFEQYLKLNYPDLYAKFVGGIKWSVLGDRHGAEKPLEMSDEDFTEYRRLEYNWGVENGCIHISTGKVGFVQVKGGSVVIDPHNVVSVNYIDDKKTQIIVKNSNRSEDVYIVAGSKTFVDELLSSE